MQERRTQEGRQTTVISPEIKAKLEAIGREIKAILPDCDGHIQVNLSRNHDCPKVNVMIADVTKVKK